MAGWIDTTFYGEVGDYLSRHGAPLAVQASAALLKALRAFDLTAAAAAADLLRVGDPGVRHLLPPPVPLDAAVAAYLGAGWPRAPAPRLTRWPRGRHARPAECTISR